jgi:hypothetical protein
MMRCLSPVVTATVFAVTTVLGAPVALAALLLSTTLATAVPVITENDNFPISVTENPNGADPLYYTLYVTNNDPVNNVYQFGVPGLFPTSPLVSAPAGWVGVNVYFCDASCTETIDAASIGFGQTGVFTIRDTLDPPNSHVAFGHRAYLRQHGF